MVKIVIERMVEEGKFLKKPIGILSIFFSFIIGIFIFQSFAKAENHNEYNTLSINGQLTVILQLFYLDGEVEEEIVIEKPANLASLWDEYEHWTLVDMNEEQVVFKKEIDDISPMLKANGYFGLTEDQTLSVFYGKPNNSNIIQSFYQIDIEKMETRLLKQLKEGIPVRDKNQFKQILKAFKPYSITDIK